MVANMPVTTPRMMRTMQIVDLAPVLFRPILIKGFLKRVANLKVAFRLGCHSYYIALNTVDQCRPRYIGGSNNRGILAVIVAEEPSFCVECYLVGVRGLRIWTKYPDLNVAELCDCLDGMQFRGSAL